MEIHTTSRRPIFVRRLRLIVSVLAISLVAVAAMIVPHVMHTAHAAAPKNTCAQPPTDKDPTSFTPAQLKTYGLPPRHPGQSQAQWEQIVRHIRHRLCAAPAISSGHQGIVAAVKRLSATMPWQAAASTTHEHLDTTGGNPAGNRWHASAICSGASCYAGISIYTPFTPYEPSGTTFVEGWGDWKIPCVTSPEDGSAFNQSLVMGFPWMEPSVQAGVMVTTQDVTITIYGRFPETITVTEPAYTMFVRGPNSFASTAVNCGDSVEADLIPAQPYDQVYLFDTTNSAPPMLTLPLDPQVPTTHLGCLVEAPNGGSQDLMNFGTATFNDCQAQDTNGWVGSVRFWPSVETNAIQNGVKSLTSASEFTPPDTNTNAPLWQNYGTFSIQWYSPN